MSVGLQIASVPFEMVYDSGRAPWGGQNQTPFHEATLFGDLGKLWSSSVHRKLAVSPNGQNIEAIRGDGSVVSFSGGGATWSAPQDRNETLTKGATGYVLRDQSELALEAYDLGMAVANKGLLQSLTQASGMKLSAVLSTGSTAATLAPAAGYMLSLSDPFGRSVGFTYKKITTATGDQVVIDTITDPTTNTIVAGYDANANLTSLTWQDKTVKTFVYDSANANQTWALTGVMDENAKRHATFTYDPNGWAKSTQLAGGVYAYTANYTTPPQPTIREVYDSANNVVWRYHEWTAPTGTTVTQPNGSVQGMTVKTVSSASSSTGGVNGGNLLRFGGYSQPAGAGCSASTSNFDWDANGNVAAQDDFNGHRTCYSYSSASGTAGNTSVANLEVTRVEGLTGGASGTACSGVLTSGAVLPKSTDALQISRKVSTQWHPQWALKTKQAEPKLLTTWVYNGQPDPFNGNQVASCVSNTFGGSATLPDGSPIAVLCKKVEQATTDADGSQGFNATLDNAEDWRASQRVESYTYTEYGQVLTHTDATGQTMTYSYYTGAAAFIGTAPNEAGHYPGDLQSVSNAAGHKTTYDSYDRAGRLLQSTDPNALVTQYSYTPRGWLKTQTVGTLSTSYDYWPTGLLKKVSQPDGSALHYQWDDAHRLTDVSDQVDASGAPAGNWVHYTLDNAGNRKGEGIKDASGALVRNIARNFDALNRLQNVSGAQQ